MSSATFEKTTVFTIQSVIDDMNKRNQPDQDYIYILTQQGDRVIVENRQHHPRQKIMSLIGRMADYGEDNLISYTP